MCTALEHQVQSALAKKQVLYTLQSPTKTKADLFSNDFLSLSSSPKLRSIILDRLSTEPGSFLGSTGSRLLDGNTSVHINFEAKLRDYYNAEAVLLFNSGYDANFSLFGTLPQEGDVVVYDKLVHASVIDGIRASRAAKSSHRFDHNSVTSLQSVLQMLMATHPRIRSGSSTVFVALETVYSMDGDIAPLRELVEVVESTLPKGCPQIIVDEAHSAGVFGPAGRGIISHMGLEKRVHICLYTFSKALAGSGAVVTCSPLLRSYLINFARPFMFSTAMNRMCVIAASASLDIVRGKIGDKLRERLFFLIKYANTLLRKELRGIPPDILRVPAAPNAELISTVIPILTPHVLSLCFRLQSQGWAAIPITFPTVPRGEERIRFTIHAGNSEQEIEEFVQALLDWCKKGDLKETFPQVAAVDDDIGIRIPTKL